MTTLDELTLSLDDLRAATLQTIVTLHRVNGLPCPEEIRTQQITPDAKTVRSLFLTFAGADEVDGWAKHLGLSADCVETANGRVYSAAWFAWPRTAWLGWHSVRLTALLPKPELVAAAHLQPDDPRLPGGAS